MCRWRSRGTPGYRYLACADVYAPAGAVLGESRNAASNALSAERCAEHDGDLEPGRGGTEVKERTALRRADVSEPQGPPCWSPSINSRFWRL